MPVAVPVGVVVRAEVVCQHPFGLGLYLPEIDTYGNVNIVNIPSHDGAIVSGPAQFPKIGSSVRARSLGVSGNGQLTLDLKNLDENDPKAAT